jgi:hypothetical protein
VRDLIQPGQTIGNAVNYPRQTVGTRNQNAAVVSEGQKTPQSDITSELVTALVSVFSLPTAPICRSPATPLIWKRLMLLV